MPNPTAEDAPPAATQAPTPGMGTTAPAAPATRALDPVLAEGIDPVLLHRLYPEADSIADAANLAKAQGEATKAAGEALEAAQQAPVAVPESTP